MTQKKMRALCVPLSEAEQVRRYLREQHLLQEDTTIIKNETKIYFPIKEVPKELTRYAVSIKSFEIKAKKPHCYQDLLTLPKQRLEKLPKSYDIIGTIILIKIPTTLLPYQKEIGDALLATHKNIRTVCAIDPVSGELRIRNCMIIAGEHQTVTTHTEYGLTFHVDVATTYFSPRLASERKRIASQVKPGEVVVDLFAGVAPFSIMVARFAKPKIIYAIDKNKEAIHLAQQNVKQNHVLETVEVIYADANDAKKLIFKKADRIIMNLPFSAFQFFSVALSIAAPICNIHYYDIIKEKEIDARIEGLKKVAAEQDYSLKDVVIHKIKTYAPREFYIGLDITATKMPT
jgi:tRNA (guanine37-N1)-methyltransferase